MKESIGDIVLGVVIIAVAVLLAGVVCHGCRQVEETTRIKIRETEATIRSNIAAGLVIKPALPERWEKP